MAVIQVATLIAGAIVGLGGCSKTNALYDDAWHKTRIGDLRGAIQEAEHLAKRYPSPNSDWYWRIRELRAEILMRQGLYEDSLALVSSDLPSSLSHSDTAVWQKLTQGAALAYLSHFAEASIALNKARKLAEDLNPNLLGEALLRQGTLASLQWNLSSARTSYHEALDFSRQHNDPFLETAALGSLGLVATRMERYDQAVDWNRLALQLSELVGDLRSVTKLHGNIGWNYFLLGDFERALELYRQAQKDSISANQNQDHILWLINTGTADYSLGNYDAGSRESREALALAESLHDNGGKIYALQNLALTSLTQNRFPATKDFLDQALQLEGLGRDHPRELYTRLIDAHLDTKEKNYLRAEQAYAEISNDRESPTSMRWEAQAGLAGVNAAQGKISLAEREFNESVSTIIKAWDALEHEEFRLSFLSSAIRFYDAYVNFLIAQKRPVEALRIADKSRAQTLEHGLALGTNGKGEQSVASRPEEIAKRLNATLLFYWLGEERSHLWVITAKGVSLLQLPGRTEIDATVKSYLDTFTLPRDPLETGNADAKKLYVTLIQPAEKLIPKNSRVILLPDRGLHSLNFETLIVPGPKPHYWIEDVTLTTANSLSLLSRTSLSAPPKITSLLLMGDALSASPDFPPLQAGKEVGLVEKYFPEEGRTVLTGAQATASHFFSVKPEKFSYLHFATHGTASTSHPLESAVILSPEGDSYKLYARDIVGHPLSAYLVTISACNGSGLRTYAGEGLVGLAWAFLHAGAHNVIGGLWEVSNASTPQLMDELYKGLNSGKDPASALREAKLTLVHSTGNYRRPFYWAPFQLYAGS